MGGFWGRTGFVVTVLATVALGACVGDDAQVTAPPAQPDTLTILAVDPIDHDFGVVDVGQSVRRAFVVKNTGETATTSLQVKLGVAPGYRISNDGCSGLLLASQATCSIEIELAPKAFGASTSALELLTGDRATAKATLRGLGRDSVSLTVTKTGEGTVTGTGIDCGSDCSEVIVRTNELPKVTLTAAPTAGWFFSGWNGGGCAGLTPTCTVTMTAAQSVSAAFTKQVPLDFSLVQGPGATTSAAASPGTLKCAGACANVVTLYDVGADVTINVASTGDVYRFFGDCTGQTCKLKMTKPVSVELHTTGYNYGFVTSAEYTGNLGGLAGADAKCATLATAGKLPGTFKAWLSTGAVDAKDRFATVGGWVRTDGAILATNKASLLADTHVRNPLWFDEQKVLRNADLASERVWTGTNLDGTKLPGGGTYCQDWTDGTSASGAVIGATQAGISWSTTNASPCSESERLYCLADDLARAVPLPAVGAARRAFTSLGTVDANQGLAAMDTLCKGEATTSGLANPTTYKALLAPANGASAASRLTNPNGAKWVRVDGVELAPTAAAFLDGQFHAPLDLTAAGAVLSAEVFTGYRRASFVTRKFTDPGDYTCAGWSDATSATQAGVGTTVTTLTNFTAIYTAADPRPCNAAAHLYCVED